MNLFKNFLQESIRWIYFIMVIIAMVLVVFFYKHSPYITNQHFFLSPLVCIIVGSLFILTFLYLYKFHKLKFPYVLNNPKAIIIASILVFIFEVFICYSCFFLTAWDPGLLTNYAYEAVHGTVNDWANNYFSRYPNNLFLEYIFVTIYRFADFIGLSSIAQGTFLIVVIQCALNALTGFFTYQVAFNLTKSKKVAWFAWFLYFVLIGSTTWAIIPYSDSMTLIIPIFILWLWTTIKGNNSDYFKWFFIIVLTYLGYKIKPQTVILLIAIIGIQIISVSFRKGTFIYLVKILIPSFIMILVLNLGISKAIVSLPFDINPNLSFGMSHFLMLGLNEKTGGLYSGEDVKFSLSFKTPEERQKANIQKSIKRIKHFTPYTLAKHLTKKTLSNYGNGTFGWGQESGQYFYKTILPDKIPGVSSFVKNCVYNKGKYYRYFCSFRQLVWFICLLLSLITFSFKGSLHKLNTSSNTKTLLVMALALIGLTLFETIFEARSRYFYTYIPFFIVLSSIGIQKLCCQKSS